MDYTKRTSIEDLYRLCKKLEIKNIIICRTNELKNYLKNKKIQNYILNLDNYGNGSHWVAYSPKYKLYFDSYAQPPPLEIPKNTKLASNKKELQTIEATDCGALCCLWLYYINNKSNTAYYNLFRDVYK